MGAVLAWMMATLMAKNARVAELNAVHMQLRVEQEKLAAQGLTLAARDSEVRRLMDEASRNIGLLATRAAELANIRGYAERLAGELSAANVKQEQQRTYAHNLEKYAAATEASLKMANETIDKANEELRQLKAEVASKTSDYNEANKRNADLGAKNDALIEKLSTHKDEIVAMQQTAQLQFERVATQILEEKSGRFIESNRVNIEALLKPLGENIEKFKTKVEETYDKESKQRFSLEERVKELIEQTNIVSSEANNLATALKGQSKKQGNWGEVILESILQQSGLMKGREYFLQKNIKDDEGKNLRPDVLVSMPDNRMIIIDSKVSLVAYDRFSAADKAEEQALYLAEHLKSIRGHIEDLHGKSYDNLEASLDFTMMFLPIEPAYMVAIQADAELWAYAYARRILLISPTNLIACLKLIADLWKREMQSKNAQEIVKRGELLYEKFVSFADSIEEIGRHINKTQAVYNTAVSQLRTGAGNLVGQAMKLKSLGLKSNKEVSAGMQPMDMEELLAHKETGE